MYVGTVIMSALFVCSVLDLKLVNSVGILAGELGSMDTVNL